METTELDLESIRVSDFNTRKDTDAGTEDVGLADLANSIRELGVLQPVIVRRVSDGFYDLVAGQRRLLACQKLGLSTIPATIRDDLNDTDSTVVSLVENVQRADMNPIDKANAYRAIRAKYGDVRQVAQATGVTERTVRRYLSLLKLAPSVQDAVTTSEGADSIATLSKLADTFAPEHHEEVLDLLRGLRQKVQLEILGASGGDVNALPRLKAQIVERDLDVRMCREGLCFAMPDEWKSGIKHALAGDITTQLDELRLPPLTRSTSSTVN